MKYSIVIPCYNEAPNIINLVDTIRLYQKEHDVEFVLVENGSKDNSRKIFSDILTSSDNIKLVLVDVNQGYGYGIKQGVKQASGEYVGWVHADMQVALEDLTQFFDYIEQNENPTNILLKGKRLNRSLMDYFFTNGMGLFECCLFGTYMYDIQSIPTIMDRSLIGVEQSAPNDFSHELYVYYKAKKSNYKIVHFPVIIRNREAGDSSWNKGFMSKIKQSWRIIKASFNIRFGK